MRFAGTWSRYSKSAMPQLTSAAMSHERLLRFRRWAYHANVMKTFEQMSSRTERTTGDMWAGIGAGGRHSSGRTSLEFADEPGERAGEVENEYVAGSELEVGRDGVRGGGIIGVKQIAVGAVDELDHLAAVADLEGVMQAASFAKLHADFGCEVERAVRAQQAPTSQQPAGVARVVVRAAHGRPEC